MLVIFIVGIMSAVAIPIMRGRIDSVKWSEGLAGASTIRSSARAFCAEMGSDWSGVWANVTLAEIGLNIADGVGGDDLDGKYFTNESYELAFTAYNTYMITITAADSLSPDKPASPSVVTLDQDGVWTETP
jgi:type IV pilus assembly protein PilA